MGKHGALAGYTAALGVDMNSSAFRVISIQTTFVRGLTYSFESK